jgi:hypothetical protein
MVYYSLHPIFLLLFYIYCRFYILSLRQVCYRVIDIVTSVVFSVTTRMSSQSRIASLKRTTVEEFLNRCTLYLSCFGYNSNEIPNLALPSRCTLVEGYSKIVALNVVLLVTTWMSSQSRIASFKRTTVGKFSIRCTLCLSCFGNNTNEFSISHRFSQAHYRWRILNSLYIVSVVFR